MEKLDIALQILLLSLGTFQENPNHTNSQIDIEDKINISIEFADDLAAFNTVGFEVESTIGNIAFGKIKIKNLEALSDHPQLISAEKQNEPNIDLKDSVPSIKANDAWQRNGDVFTGYNGRGTLIGIIDTGIDFNNECFKKFNGATRIFKIWDQTLTAQGTETAASAIPNGTAGGLAAPLGYGVEYDRADINHTIGFGGGPGTHSIVRHQDQDGHGTHVAGIAGGNGKQVGACRGSYSYIGVAPEAEFIIVRMWGLTGSDRGTTAAPVNPPSASLIIDALKYIIFNARAAGKSVSINCSFGRFTEKMNGSGNINTGVNTLLTQNSAGNTVVFTAGNDAHKKWRAIGQVPINNVTPLVLSTMVKPNDATTRAIIIEYTGNNLAVQVASPLGTVPWLTANNNSTSNTANGANGSVRVFNNPNTITIVITPPPTTGTGAARVVGNNAAGTWNISLRNNGGATTTNIRAVSAWGGSDGNNRPFFQTNVSTNMTLGEYASGRECITVGAYKVNGPLANFSGRGTTTDNAARTKPEVCAPGVNIKSVGIAKDLDNDGCASCCCDCCEAFYVSMSGTSMAAPHVTGLISLMYQRNPNLTHTQVKSFLTANADNPPASTPNVDIPGWGAGKIHTTDTLAAVPQINPPIPATPMVADQSMQQVGLLEQFLATPFGRNYYELGQQYVAQIMQLINTNKRVATVWHRSRGPVWTRLALQAVHNPSAHIPQSVHGIALRDSIRDFTDILRRYASPKMLVDVNAVEPLLISTIENGNSLVDWLQILGDKEMNTRPNAERPTT